MPLVNKLLENIHFGTELEKLAEGTRFDVERLAKILNAPNLHMKHDRIVQMCMNFARRRNLGRFGGQITAGDMAFITAFMSAIKPGLMLEFGVCSGQSSAAILVVAHRLGLYEADVPFLHSFDIVETFNGHEKTVGQVVERNFPERLSHWSLFTRQTSESLLMADHPTRIALEGQESVLAFIDAEHRHPEPLVDILILNKILPSGSWILLQDIRLMERWLANSIERGVVCPAPERGVEHVMTHWPGRKVTGQGSSYNMGAISTGANMEDLRIFVDSCLSYPIEVDDGEERKQFIRSLIE